MRANPTPIIIVIDEFLGVDGESAGKFGKPGIRLLKNIKKIVNRGYSP